MVIAGEQTQDFVIDAPVAEVWAIYGTTKLSEIIRAKKFFEDIQIDGDGGVGTFINITPLPGQIYDPHQIFLTPCSHLLLVDSNFFAVKLLISLMGMNIRWPSWKVQGEVGEGGP